MASRIEGYDKKIIDCSLKEFLEKGYNDASLRNIASAAGVSTSTIYTRFKDKEGLFNYLIAPTNKFIEYMEKTLHDYSTMSLEKQKDEYDNISDEGFDKFIELVYEDYHAYKLLVSCSHGDTFNNYLEKITSLDVVYTMKFLKDIGSKAFKTEELDEGFCHVVSTAFYSALFHCVEHDMSKEEAVKYINKLRNFYQRGWSAYF